MTYTNTGLVKHAEMALQLKTKYMWGGLLREITPAYIAQLRKMYGTKAGTGYTEARYAELQGVVGKGYFGVDCIGLIKSYYFSGKPFGGTGSPNYASAMDVNAGTMYSRATEKGKISTMPEIPGLIVYSKTHPHVGIYIGGGKTIESTLGARGDGVVKRKLDSFWEYWFECPYIEYKTDKPATDEQLETVTLAYDAAIRSEPRASSQKIGLLTGKTKCVIVKGSDTDDPVTKYTYVRLAGGKEQWIVKSAIKQ